jgi:hypothetical protein
VGKGATDEDSKLKDAAEKHDGEDWAAISVLVPGRTSQQCCHRWYYVLVSKKNETTSRGSRWTEEEDSKLRGAVEKHNGTDWATIIELFPCRTKQQCRNRWHNVLNSKSDETTAHLGKWTKEEDVKPKDAVDKHKDEGWAAISARVPGRTKHQCANRWHNALDTKKNETTSRGGKWARKGIWTKEEDLELKGAVEKHVKNWASIAVLVPGRTKQQCLNRWHRLGLQERRDDRTCE